MPGCHGRLIQQRHTVPVISIVTSTFIPIRLPYLVLWSEVFRWPATSWSDDGGIRHGTAGSHGYATCHSTLRDVPMLLVGAMR